MDIDDRFSLVVIRPNCILNKVSKQPVHLEHSVGFYKIDSLVV